MYRKPETVMWGLLYAILLTCWTLNTQSASNEMDSDSDNTIVVLGKIPNSIEGIIGSASVISSQQIDENLVQDISDLIRYESGVSVEKSGSRFGYSGFSIRGIGGNRIATEVDGIPVAEKFDIGSYSNSTRNLVDPELIQQVEILRGPASGTYGSDAIGGIVSYITKKPVDFLSKTNSDYYLGFKSGFRSIDSSKMINISQAVGNEEFSALLALTKRQGHEFDSQSEMGSEDDEQTNKSFSAHGKLVWTISDEQELSLHFDNYQRESQTNIRSFLGSGRFRNTSVLLGDDTTSNNRVALHYELGSPFSIIDGGVIRLFSQKAETEQLTDETRFSRGVNFQFDRDFFFEQKSEGVRLNFYSELIGDKLSHKLGYGLEWQKNRIEELRDGLQTNMDTGTSTNTILSESFPLRDFPISRTSEVGVYISDEITLASSSLRLIPALRYDYYQLKPRVDTIYNEDNPATKVVSISENSISPKLGLTFQPSEASEIYLQYVRGFRAPPFEDANIGLDIALFNIRAIPNPELKSEKSNGVELGLNYQTSQQTFGLVLFQNNYQDFIQTKVNLGLDPISGRILFQSQNIDRAEIYGAEINYENNFGRWLDWDSNIRMSLSAYWNKSKNKINDKPLNSLQPNQLQIGLHWSSSNEKWKMDIYSILVDAKDEIDETDTELFAPDGYGILDLITNYRPTESVLLSLGIFNVLDKKYWRWFDVNGLAAEDPVIESLSAAGINASLQIRFHW